MWDSTYPQELRASVIVDRTVDCTVARRLVELGLDAEGGLQPLHWEVPYFQAIRSHQQCGDQKIARFRTHYLRNKFSICEY